MTFYDDLNDHPVAVFHAGESFVSDSEKAWLRWVRAAEKILGHDLDGDDVDDKGDGYSLDEAYGAWEAGEPAADYIAEVKARERYNPANAKPSGTGAPR